MAYEAYGGAYEDQKARMVYFMTLFQYARLQRVNFEAGWEENASLVWPEYRNSFTFGHMRAPGVKYTQFQVDSGGAIAAWRFMSIADMMMTPFYLMWSEISTDNEYLLKQRPAKLYFEEWTRRLWAQRYRPDANFAEQQQTNWMSLGVFGNQYMLCDALDTRPAGYRRGLRYMAPTIGEIYLLVNHQGRVDGYIRHFRWVARQAYQRWPETISPTLKSALEVGDALTRYDFLEFVLPNTEYDPHQAFSRRGKPWSSTYCSMIDWSILEDRGYDSFPLAVGRYGIAPEEWFGRGFVDLSKPDLKTKNAARESFLRNIDEGSNPYRLLPAEGLQDFMTRDDKRVFGGVDEEGRPLVHNLEPPDPKYSVEAMEACDKVINAASLMDLYGELFDKTGQPRSAREVVEASNNRTIFLGPLAKQFGYLSDLIRREMVIMRAQGLAPEMPGVVREAAGDFKVTHISPMARAFAGEPVAGLMRLTEMMAQISQAQGGNTEIFDEVDYGAAIPEMGQSLFVPTRWMPSPEMRAQRAQARARAQQQDQYVKSLPGLAAKAKADAISAKAAVGQNIGGTLSGVAPGGMPMMPTNPRGTVGMQGIGGRPGRPGLPAPGGV